MSFLGSLALYLTVEEINRFIDKRTSNAERERLANKIINQAEKRGQEALTKALNDINNIPMISGSPTLMHLLRDARSKAVNRYSQVERAVNDLRSNATEIANDITKINDQGLMDKVFGKRNNEKYINSKEEQFNKTLENFESKINN